MHTMPKEPPITVLLGLPFHDVTLEETLDYCADAMRDDQQHYIVTANADFTTQAYEDPDLKKIVFFADRVVCDGMPLVWLSKWFGYPLRERVAGSDMVPRLLDTCAKEGYGVYFFGSDQNTLEEAKVIVEQRYPGLKVVGVDAPPFGAVVEWENDELCAKMRASGAKLLLVCLGCPKQERWIFAHHKECGIPLSIGCGASLDFITGKQRRAPKWMQKSGLEWFWRMSSSPGRLVGRYKKDLFFLVRASLEQARAQRRRSDIVQQQSATGAPQPDSRVVRLQWGGELQAAGLAGAPVPESVSKPVVLDASRVTFIDSSGLGRLAQLTRVCRVAEKMLVVVRPSEAFRSAVRAVRMDSLFPILESEEQAIRLISEYETSSGGSKVDEGGVVTVSFNRSLDALYFDEMMTALDSAIADSPGIRTLVVDLREVSFIDSRAVGGLIRVWKTMTSKGGGMYLSGATPAVREIISLLRLDKFLTEWKGVPAQ